MTNEKLPVRTGSQPPPAVNARATARSVYKRNLPHIQARSAAYFVTFATRKRWILPETVRAAVLTHCLHDHESKILMHAAVVMPDHVHLLFSTLGAADGEPFTLAEIMSSIKGASAHTVNKLLSRKGPVWEEESFDRLLRRDEKLREKAEYICANPIRANLAAHEDEWPWLWREWAEGLARNETSRSGGDFTAGGGCDPVS
jgi:REP element-mobilizing transposase RayT